jgi:DNA-binding NarL/FixJ family response regulator
MVPNETRKDELRVMIVDDHPIVREGLGHMLGEAGYVVSEASDGTQAVKLAASLRPQLIVMDVVMPGMSGIEATQRVRAQDPTIHVLMFSMREDPETVLAALKAGATSYLSKAGTSGPVLLDAVRRTIEGQAVFVPGHLVNLVVHQWTRRSNFDTLSSREREIVTLAAKGLSNRQIAERLVVSVRTIENHLYRACIKLGTTDRTELATLLEGH